MYLVFNLLCFFFILSFDSSFLFFPLFLFDLFWQEVLSSELFYKKYTLHNYDLTEGKPTLYLNEWQDPEEWTCYWAYEGGPDQWVFAKPPKEWKCGIVHPADLKPETDETIKFSDFLLAMTKLDKFNKDSRKLKIMCGKYECRVWMCFLVIVVFT